MGPSWHLTSKNSPETHTAPSCIMVRYKEGEAGPMQNALLCKHMVDDIQGVTGTSSHCISMQHICPNS